jgi:hypothetical protein
MDSLDLIDLRFSESSDNELLHLRKLNRRALFPVAAYKYSIIDREIFSNRSLL